MTSFKNTTLVTYPLCLNASTTRSAYQVFDLDNSVVIDQSRIIRYKGSGVKVTEIRAMIDNLLTTSLPDPSGVPESPVLLQNYPNPFNPATNIRFELDRSEKVSLKIYDNQGRLIRTLLDNTMNAGRHELSWNGLTNNGEPAASGVYYYVLSGETFRKANKMNLIK